MIRVRHNGQETLHDPTLFGDLGELVQSCLQQAGEGHLLTRLVLDGREIAETDSEPLERIGLEGLALVELESKPMAEVALGALAHAGAYVDAIRTALAQTAGLFRSGRVEQANQLYAELVDAFSICVYALQAACDVLGETARALRGVESELQPWLEALVEAQEQRDWIRVADCLEYELAPLFEGWVRRIRETREHCAEEGNP
jgi:hypothetical protein